MEITLFKAIDNACAPVIETGDIVFVGRTQQITSSGFYALRTDFGTTIFVRAQIQASGQVLATMDNAEQFEYTCGIDSFQYQMIGKVLWVLRRYDYQLPHEDMIHFMTVDPIDMAEQFQQLFGDSSV